MQNAWIVSQLDAEITMLQQVKQLLMDANLKTGRGRRPKYGIVTVATLAAATKKGARKRILSPEANVKKAAK